VGIVVENVTKAYFGAVDNGAMGVVEPTLVKSYCGGHDYELAEIQLYGDVVLRLINFKEANVSMSNGSDAPFLPHLAPYPSRKNKPNYGLTRLDHTVGNVPNLLEAQKYIQSFSNYHPFAEFTPEDIGTVDSGLNSVVLASKNEEVLLPLNEPTEGKRKSQIQTFLEQNEGPGLQHIAIKTDDIFETITKMRYAEENLGGFELMVRPSDGYYRELPDRLGDKLTEEQYSKLEELGILADADEDGVLLQIFTKPLGDRPTLFIEIIQRIGCVLNENDQSKALNVKPGCGGFGQGNFRELFKAIEDHEKTLKV
jgi:4-hydroxyphenylpyruvate dioxygenase